MKIRANDIDHRDAERFDSFFSVIFNCKIEYCRFNKKLNNFYQSSIFSFLSKQQYVILQLKMTLKKLSKRSASLRSISLALIFMLHGFGIFCDLIGKPRSVYNDTAAAVGGSCLKQVVDIQVCIEDVFVYALLCLKIRAF